jgi:hypothetical protein
MTNTVMSDKDVKNLMEMKVQVSDNKSWGFDLNEKDFCKGMILLNPQSYGFRLQNYIQKTLGFAKIPSKDGCGDIRPRKLYKESKNFEVKVSLLTRTNETLNIVQIRLFHNVQYYLCVAYDMRDISNFKKYIFLLTHKEMDKECEKMNASGAHGTKTLNIENKHIELRLSLKCLPNNIHFKRWLEKYSIKSFEEIHDLL